MMPRGNPKAGIFQAQKPLAFTLPLLALHVANATKSLVIRTKV